jgi:hypothetical protein
MASMLGPPFSNKARIQPNEASELVSLKPVTLKPTAAWISSPETPKKAKNLRDLQSTEETCNGNCSRKENRLAFFIFRLQHEA